MSGQALPNAVNPESGGAVTDSAVPLEQDVVSELRAAIVILARRMRYQQVGLELSASESAVLGRVRRRGPLTPGELARAEHVQPPSMTRLLERLEAKKFVRRDTDPTDRRQVLLTITDSGLDYIERNKAARVAWLTAMLGRLGEADRDRVLAAAPALLRLAELP